jgi:glycosyltransferase involved in cell wall biosynthesis
MKLVIQMPALNEEKTIKDVIEAIPRDIDGIDEYQVLVVNDGSTDRTAEIAAAAGADVVSHEQRMGVGAAFRTGIARATELRADIIVTIDSDGQFNPEDISKVIAPILKNEADFVTASRFIDPEFLPTMTRAKRWGNDLIARWLSALTKQRFYDVSCGFRAYSSNAYQRLVPMGEFTYTHETFLTLAFSGIRIKEVPVHVRGIREHGKSRVAGNLFKYGWRAAVIILKTYRDYKPLRFFGSMSGVLTVFALGFFAFLMYVKNTTGVFTPHKWSGFMAGSFAAAAIATFLMGVVAEMLDRIRIAQDEILFRVRRLEAKLTDNTKK